MKNCIVSFANSKGNYVKALSRLHESLRNNFDGDFLGFINESSIGSPLHSENPYAFKVYAIMKAIDAGYRKILYVDSSCFAVANVSPAFDEISNNGFLFQFAGHYAGEWTNDYTLSYFGVKRDDAMSMPMIGNAGMLGLNFDMEEPNEFFKRWKVAMENGCFKGRWNNNDKTESQDERCKGARHDMSSSSIILNLMGKIMIAKNGDEFLQYAGVFDKTLNDSIIFKAQGM